MGVRVGKRLQMLNYLYTRFSRHYEKSREGETMGLFNMRMITLVCLMLVSTLLAAQEKEIWACQGIDSNGFLWNGGRWDRSGFKSRNVLLTLNGINSILKQDDYDFETVCRKISGTHITGPWWSCLTDSPSTHFVLNPATGEAGASNLLGVLELDRDRRDGLDVELYQCTKF